MSESLRVYIRDEHRLFGSQSDSIQNISRIGRSIALVDRALIPNKLVEFPTCYSPFPASPYSCLVYMPRNCVIFEHLLQPCLNDESDCNTNQRESVC